MKKIKVIKAFYDKEEGKYVYPDKETTIEREEKRAEKLIKAKVCAEIKEVPVEKPKATGKTSK